MVGGLEKGIKPEQIIDALGQKLRVRISVRVEEEKKVGAKMMAHGGRKPKKIFDYRHSPVSDGG